MCVCVRAAVAFFSLARVFAFCACPLFPLVDFAGALHLFHCPEPPPPVAGPPPPRETEGVLSFVFLFFFYVVFLHCLAWPFSLCGSFNQKEGNSQKKAIAGENTPRGVHAAALPLDLCGARTNRLCRGRNHSLCDANKREKLGTRRKKKKE